MKKIVLFLLAIILSFGIIGCDPTPTGYVYQKEYIPSYWSYNPVFIGKTIMLEPVYHEAIYDLDLTSCSSLQTDGDCQTNQIEVTEDQYNSYKVGQYWSEKGN